MVQHDQHGDGDDRCPARRCHHGGAGEEEVDEHAGHAHGRCRCRQDGQRPAGVLVGVAEQDRDDEVREGGHHCGRAPAQDGGDGERVDQQPAELPVVALGGGQAREHGHGYGSRQEQCDASSRRCGDVVPGVDLAEVVPGQQRIDAEECRHASQGDHGEHGGTEPEGEPLGTSAHHMAHLATGDLCPQRPHQHGQGRDAGERARGGRGVEAEAGTDEHDPAAQAHDRPRDQGDGDRAEAELADEQALRHDRGHTGRHVGSHQDQGNGARQAEEVVDHRRERAEDDQDAGRCCAGPQERPQHRRGWCRCRRWCRSRHRHGCRHCRHRHGCRHCRHRHGRCHCRHRHGRCHFPSSAPFRHRLGDRRLQGGDGQDGDRDQTQQRPERAVPGGTQHAAHGHVEHEVAAVVGERGEEERQAAVSGERG